MARTVSSGSLGGVMGRTPAQNARNLGSIAPQGVTFSISLPHAATLPSWSEHGFPGVFTMLQSCSQHYSLGVFTVLPSCSRYCSLCVYNAGELLTTLFSMCLKCLPSCSQHCSLCVYNAAELLTMLLSCYVYNIAELFTQNYSLSVFAMLQAVHNVASLFTMC